MARAKCADLEDQLVVIWERLLSAGHIDVWQNFFELGGDALLAADMICKVEEVTGKRLSLHAVIKAPTIMELADMIGDKNTGHGRKRRAA